jgi:hypothetical protein
MWEVGGGEEIGEGHFDGCWVFSVFWYFGILVCLVLHERAILIDVRPCKYIYIYTHTLAELITGTDIDYKDK